MMEFSLHMSPKDLDEVIRRGVRAEELGYAAFFFADSHLNALDAFQTAACVARATTRLRFGTAVSNMVFRDPTILAGLAATTSSISGGRFMLGLGTGDGTTYRLGRNATRMNDFEQALAQIRSLLRGGTVDGPHGPFGFQLAGFSAPPVLAGVEGPRGLRAAGRVADGVILGGGFDLNLLDRSLELIAEGAAEAGRTFDDILLIGAGMVAIDDDGAAAKQRIKSRIANRAHHNFRHSLASVPPEHLDEVKAFLAGFDITRPIDERADPALIGPYLLGRFSIAGDPQECRARVAELEAHGISHIMLTPHSRWFDQTMDAWATGVIHATKPQR